MPNTLNEDVLVAYEVDARASRLTIRAFATGFLSAFGHNPSISVRNLRGEARLASQTLDGASLRAAVAVDSLAVENDISDKDRRENAAGNE